MVCLYISIHVTPGFLLFLYFVLVSNRCVFTNHVASKIKMLELRHVSATPTTTSIGKLWKSFENIILFLFFFIQMISRKRNRTQMLGQKTFNHWKQIVILVHLDEKYSSCQNILARSKFCLHENSDLKHRSYVVGCQTFKRLQSTRLSETHYATWKVSWTTLKQNIIKSPVPFDSFVWSIFAHAHFNLY